MDFYFFKTEGGDKVVLSQILNLSHFHFHTQAMDGWKICFIIIFCRQIFVYHQCKKKRRKEIFFLFHLIINQIEIYISESEWPAAYNAVL